MAINKITSVQFLFPFLCHLIPGEYYIYVWKGGGGGGGGGVGPQMAGKGLGHHPLPYVTRMNTSKNHNFYH